MCVSLYAERHPPQDRQGAGVLVLCHSVAFTTVVAPACTRYEHLVPQVRLACTAVAVLCAVTEKSRPVSSCHWLKAIDPRIRRPPAVSEPFPATEPTYNEAPLTPHYNTILLRCFQLKRQDLFVTMIVGENNSTVAGGGGIAATVRETLASGGLDGAGIEDDGSETRLLDSVDALVLGRESGE